MRVLISLCLVATAMLAQQAPGFEPGALNRNVDPCVNFYQYAYPSGTFTVDNTWTQKNPQNNDSSGNPLPKPERRGKGGAVETVEPKAGFPQLPPLLGNLANEVNPWSETRS